jgi:hypothetical protein
LLAGLAVVLADLPVFVLLPSLFAIILSSEALVRRGRDPFCLRPTTICFVGKRSKLVFEGQEIDCGAPELRFNSEWLLVLKFVEKNSGRKLVVNLWPDSLDKRDSWRLRRLLNGYPLLPQ